MKTDFVKWPVIAASLLQPHFAIAEPLPNDIRGALVATIMPPQSDNSKVPTIYVSAGDQSQKDWALGKFDRLKSGMGGVPGVTLTTSAGQKATVLSTGEEVFAYAGKNIGGANPIYGTVRVQVIMGKDFYELKCGQYKVTPSARYVMCVPFGPTS